MSQDIHQLMDSALVKLPAIFRASDLAALLGIGKNAAASYLRRHGDRFGIVAVSATSTPKKYINPKRVQPGCRLAAALGYSLPRARKEGRIVAFPDVDRLAMPKIGAPPPAQARRPWLKTSPPHKPTSPHLRAFPFVEPDMTARYDRTAHYVTITDDRIGDILVQRCRSIAEARKIARAHGATLTEA